MSVESPRIVTWSPMPSKKGDMAEIPSERVLKFSYRSFKSGRVYFAKKQIGRLVCKMMARPEKKSYFIQEINKLILYELGENRFE